MFLTIISTGFFSEHTLEPTLTIVPPLALCKNLVQHKPEGITKKFYLLFPSNPLIPSLSSFLLKKC